MNPSPRRVRRTAFLVGSDAPDTAREEQWTGIRANYAWRVPQRPDLIAAIDGYLQVNNPNPTPFVWTATADSILEKVRRGRVALETITT
jgi:hypothetical protein